MNKTTIIGNLGRDPEMRYAPSGDPVTTLNVGVDESYTDKTSGARVKRSVWYKVSVWGRRGEVCNQYLKKGSKVLVEGTLQGEYTANAQGVLTCNGPRVWTRQDGTPGASFELKAINVEFLSAKGDVADDAPDAPDATAAPDLSDPPF